MERVSLAEALADVLAVARGSQSPNAGETAERYIAEQSGEQDADSRAEKGPRTADKRKGG